MSDSSDNVESFFELCSQDQALRQQIKTLNDEQIVSLANSKGLAFTIEDLESVLSPGGDSEELSDKDLELVAGGARALNAVSDGLVCNTIRSLFSTESGCGGGFKFKGRKKTI
jgi:predicted ribosomally synthesized peptide with nif11-like leader